eukprot:Selendium_serpulae@DN26_c0_g1_i1.p1
MPHPVGLSGRRSLPLDPPFDEAPSSSNMARRFPQTHTVGRSDFNKALVEWQRVVDEFFFHLSGGGGQPPAPPLRPAACPLRPAASHRRASPIPPHARAPPKRSSSDARPRDAEPAAFPSPRPTATGTPASSRFRDFAPCSPMYSALI